MSLQLNGTDGVTFNDGSEQWAAASPIGTKNLIINGNMQIAQRGTSQAGLTNGSNGYYTVDRWKWQEAGTPSFVVTMSQDTDVPTGQGFSNSLKYDITTSDASLATNDALFLYQNLEGQNLQHLKYGTSSAESVTLSFWVKSNKTGTYVCELYDTDNTKTIAETYTINAADTWEKKTITLEGNTSDSLDNDNNLSLSVGWWFAAGTDFTSGTLNTTWQSATSANRAVGQTVNLADSTSNYINITGVQLEVGDTATPFEVVPYDMNLARCQRYYYRNSADSNYMSYASGRANSTTVGVFTYNHPVTMRASPTYTQSGTGVNTPSQITTTSLGTIYAGKNSSFVTVNVASGLTAGYGLLWNSNNNTTSYVEANAEL